jgi:hypothetical protein
MPEGFKMALKCNKCKHKKYCRKHSIKKHTPRCEEIRSGVIEKERAIKKFSRRIGF